MQGIIEHQGVQPMVLLGKKIKELRIKSKFTQLELAEKLGVTKSSVVSYENDSRQPSYGVLIKMAHIFHVSVDYLLLERSDMTLEVTGLRREQIELLKSLITDFQKNNLLENYLKNTLTEKEFERLGKDTGIQIKPIN